MSDPLEQSLIDLGLSIVGWSTRYDCLTMQKRCITGGRQRYRKKYYAFVEIQRPTGRCWCTLKHLLKSKANDKGQAQHEARLLFKEYYPNRWRTLHVEEELVPVKHRKKQS